MEEVWIGKEENIVEELTWGDRERFAGMCR
jgi:hypothetical protein